MIMNHEKCLKSAIVQVANMEFLRRVERIMDKTLNTEIRKSLSIKSSLFRRKKLQLHGFDYVSRVSQEKLKILKN